ncbi:WD repeat-containing protein 75-like [Amphiura filiformis]|uniref:WD repeat-containing protein 75-like n=1 Tax=Amphiura filiformis TaxID=82378 RepID=UPI003B221DF5
MATSTELVGRVVVRGGASLVKRRPVFSADSKYIFVCSGEVIRVFSVASGEFVTELWGHRNEVTAVRVNPLIQLQLFSSSLDGTINLWDYADGILLKTFTLGLPLFGLLVHADLKNKLYVQIPQDSGKEDDEFLGKLAIVHLPSRQSSSRAVPVQASPVINKIKVGDRGTAIGAGGEYVAAIHGSKLKVVFTANEEENAESVYLSENRSSILTCVACHPTDYAIATGNANGHVTLWRNFNKSKPVLSSEHWHSLRVEDVGFSPEGSYLYSVGHECTLVQWQYNSKHRDFIPRLGAPISHVSCSHDNQYKALCLTSNAIIVLKVDKIKQKIQGLSFGDYTRTGPVCIPTGLTTDPHTKALVLNGTPGHLQFYHLQQDKLLYNLDIVGENYISPESLDKPLVNTEVELVAFDTEGAWLATIERRDDKETSMEMRLKFWGFDKEKQSFKLNTVIESPHESQVYALQLRSTKEVDGFLHDPLAVTTANDKKFKVWRLLDDEDVNSKMKTWNCTFVGSYRNLQPKDASFCADGSLLAVSFAQIITIWDPDTNELKRTFCQGTPDDPIESLYFGHISSSCHLVASTKGSITVWNLLTCSVLWNVSLGVHLLIEDPLSCMFAVIDIANNLFVFNTSEPRIIYAQKSLLKQPIDMAIFTPLVKNNQSSDGGKSPRKDLLPWEHVSQLYLMTRKQDLFSLVSERRDQEEGKEFQSHGQMSLHTNLQPTPFAMLLGRERAKDDEEETGLDAVRIQGALGTASVKQMLSSPAHTLPPAKTLCSSFLKTMLPPAGDAHTRMVHSDSEDELGEKDESDKSDMEDDAHHTEHAQSMNQSGQVVKSHDQGYQVENVQDIHLSDVELHKLEKAARTGFKWMKPVFKDVLS